MLCVSYGMMNWGCSLQEKAIARRMTMLDLIVAAISVRCVQNFWKKQIGKDFGKECGQEIGKELESKRVLVKKKYEAKEKKCNWLFMALLISWMIYIQISLLSTRWFNCRNKLDVYVMP